MATIHDVAARAGVSIATVSRVLNGKTKGPAAARVMEAVEALAYVPNPAARNLRHSESRVILILAPNMTNPYYASIALGINRTAYDMGFTPLLYNTFGSRRTTQERLSLLERRQADGAILMAPEQGSEWLAGYASRYPIVQCSEYDPDVPIPHVCVDNYRAAREATAYLRRLGHKRIGIISSVNRYVSTDLRLRGYLDELRSSGLPAGEAYIRRAAEDYSFKSGFDAAASLLSQEERPTALFCISDMLALGAIASAQEMGFKVPRDVSIVGFDDVEYTTMFHPYVTTVAQPREEIGVKAVELLAELMAGGRVREQVLLPHKLIPRETTAPRHREAMEFAASMKGR